MDAYPVPVCLEKGERGVGEFDKHRNHRSPICIDGVALKCHLSWQPCRCRHHRMLRLKRMRVLGKVFPDAMHGVTLTYGRGWKGKGDREI